MSGQWWELDWATEKSHGAQGRAGQRAGGEVGSPAYSPQTPRDRPEG